MLTILPERDQGILLARLDVLYAEAEVLQEQVDEQVREVRELLGKAETVWEPSRGRASELHVLLGELEMRLLLLPPAEREQVVTQMMALELAAQERQGKFGIVPQLQKAKAVQSGPMA